jgi:ParB family chromosome partitioning protein
MTKAAAAIPAPPEVAPATAGEKKPAKAASAQLPFPAVIVAGDRKTVPWSSLQPSSLNPRTHFDPEAMATLADNIASVGILQNLTVRPAAKKADALEIVAGERRYRAVEALIKAGRAKPEYPVPVNVQEISDAELVAVAMAENMARNELTPMEEARGYAKLIDLGVPTETIARRVGVTQRLIQQRLTLVKKAVTEVQQALDDGKITVTHARALTLAKPSEQKKLVKRLVDPDSKWLRDEERLRNEITGSYPEVTLALFDRKLYDGEVVEDEDDGIAYFTDVKQFEKLQRAAIAAKVEELKKTAAWVKVFDRTKNEWFDKYAYIKRAHTKEKGAVVVVDRNLSIEITLGLTPSNRAPAYGVSTAGDRGSAKSARKAQPEDAFTHGHRVHAHLRKTFALQRALAADPLTGQRMLCHALLMDKGCDPLNIRRASSFHDRRGFKDHQGSATAPEVNALLAKLLDGCPGVKVSEKAGFQEAGDSHALAVWEWLVKQKTDLVIHLLAALVADQAGTWCDGHTMPIDDDEIAFGVAQQLNLVGNEQKAGLTLRPEDLEGLRKPALLGLCRELKLDADSTWRDGMTGTALIGLISKKLKAGPVSYVLPTLRFSSDSTADIKALTKDSPTKPATKPAAKTKTKAKAKKKAKR